MPPENSDSSNKNYLFYSINFDKIQKSKRIFFYYSNIKTYIKRQFLFQNQGIEFFLKNGKSFFLIYYQKKFRRYNNNIRKKNKNKFKK